MKKLRRFTATCLFLFLSASISPAQAALASQAGLAEALKRKDPEGIRQAVIQARKELGKKAGEPEVDEKYRSTPAMVHPLSRKERSAAIRRTMAEIEKRFRSNSSSGPTSHPLRETASVLSWATSLARTAQGEDQKKLMGITKTAANQLMAAQEQGGGRLYPFPAVRGVQGNRAMEVADRFLERATRMGILQQVVTNGWIVDDLGDGGLQFDNGECGMAMLEYFDLTRDAAVLQSALRATDYAKDCALVTNWNYNSFSVWLLARASRVTGNRAYFEAALLKAKLGVIPGQLVDGKNKGRWMDPHNARAVYHFILLRGLGELLHETPEEHPDRSILEGALLSGLKARNREILERGVMNRDKALEALIAISSAHMGNRKLMRNGLVQDALAVVVADSVAEIRQGKNPLGPREFGQLMEYLGRRESR